MQFQTQWTYLSIIHSVFWPNTLCVLNKLKAIFYDELYRLKMYIKYITVYVLNKSIR